MTLKAGTQLLRVIAALAFTLPVVVSAQSIFTHAHLRVPNGQQAQAAAWYKDVLGGEAAEIGPGPISRFHNGFIGTMANEGLAADGSESVIDHIGVAVPNVGVAAERVRELGGTVRSRRDLSANETSTVVVTDPWGGSFELIERPELTGVHHVHFFASNAAATRDWFLQVFGGAYDEERGRDSAHVIHYGDVMVQISQAADDDQRGPSRLTSMDHIGFRVPSLDEFRIALEASGYEPYLERPNPPGADLMFFEGPDGLHVEMTEPVR